MKKAKIDTNITKNTKQVPVRWPFDMLEDSRECATYMNETWSDFIRAAVKEKIEKVKIEMEKNN